MEKKENYNRKLRHLASKFDLDIRKMLNVDRNMPLKYQVLVKKLNNDFPEFDVIDSLFYMVGYSDLYKLFVYKSEKGKLSELEKRYFTLLKTVKDYNDLSSIYSSNPVLKVLALDSMIEFCNLNAYEKIIRIKMLEEDDLIKLQRVNTINYQDIENYDVDVNIDLIMNQIEKGKNTYDILKLLMDAAKFIKKLCKMENLQTINMVKKLVYNDIKMLNYVLKNENIDLSCMDEDEKDKIIKAKERLEKFKSVDVDEYIDGLRIYQIMDILDSYINYNEYFNLEKDDNAVDMYLEKNTNSSLKEKLMILEQEVSDVK